MKYTLPIAAIVLLASCASSSPSSMTSSASNAVAVHLAQAGTPAETYYFRGPIPIEFQLTVTNPTNQPMTLRKLNLSTTGPGAYSLRTGDSTLNYTIPPNATTTIALSAWGRSAGGFLRGGEPVNIRGIAYFDSPSGGFARQFMEYLPQQ